MLELMWVTVRFTSDLLSLPSDVYCYLFSMLINVTVFTLDIRNYEGVSLRNRKLHVTVDEVPLEMYEPKKQ